MSVSNGIFQRKEKKYFLTLAQKDALLKSIGSRLYEDEHGKSTVCSLYVDTPDFLLIRNSVDAKDEEAAYKEKIRMRSYGTPTPDSAVFLELKKKYKGIVYKRRIEVKLRDAEEYFKTGRLPAQSQIMNEIDYAMRFYHNPKPRMMIAYEREAYYSKEDSELRITFDSSVRYRKDDLFLESGSHGKKIINDGEYLMEVKTDGAMPLWLADALDECKIYPASFSKYGTAYGETLRAEKETAEYEEIIFIADRINYKRKGELKYV